MGFVLFISLCIAVSPSLTSPSFLIGGAVNILLAYAIILLLLTVPRDERLFGSLAKVRAENRLIARQIPRRRVALARLVDKITRAEHALNVIESSYAAAVANHRRQQLLSLAWSRFLDPDFKKFLADLFTLNGYSVVLDNSDACGVDLFVIRNGRRIAVRTTGFPQAAIDSGPIADVLVGSQFYGCDGAAVITNAMFNRGAQGRANASGCLLIDSTQIAELAYDQIRLA